MKVNKTMAFVLTLMVLIIGISAVSAADIDNNNTDVGSAVSVSSVSSQASDVSDVASVEKETKTVKSEAKSVKKEDKTVNTVKKDSSVKTTKTTQKSLKTEDPISVDNDNFDDYFTSTGFTEKVSDGASITFSTDVSRNGTSYVVNKPVNINGNGYTLSLNTTSGSYFGNETGSAFIIDNGAAGTNLTNLNFYNTQVFVRNTTNVVIDHINSTVKDQRIGSGVGTFSVRDGSTFVTVNNSNFYTENNEGSSSLVLAGVNYCTFNNNTVTGVGTVGNLIYLTTYNVEGVSEDDCDINSFNNITNNVVNGPETASSILYGIALTGHDNIIENNTVNVSGQGITTQWAYRDPSDPSNGTNSDRYKGNTYKNNIVLRGASFKATNNSTITGNKLSGSLTTGINATVEDNVVNGTITIQKGSNMTNNIVRSNVAVSGSDVVIKGNSIHGNVTVKSTVSDATINNNNVCGYIISNSINYNDDSYNNYCNETCNCGVEGCSCDGCMGSSSSSKSLKTADETNETKVFYVNEDNFNTYFAGGNANQLRTNKTLYNNSLFVFDSTVPNAMKDIKIFYLSVRGLNYNITGGNNSVVFYNNYFYKSSQSNVHISNITFVYTDYAKYPEDDASCCLVRAFGNITFENCVFKAEIDEFNDNIPEGSSIIVTNPSQSGRDVVFKNCIFNFTIPTDDIDWDVQTATGIPRLVPISVLNGYTQFINNTIECEEGQYIGNASTCEPFYFTGSNSIVVNNTVFIKGLVYLYGMYFQSSSNNTITGNNITVVGSKYTNGIYFAGSNYGNNTISNNYINLTSGNHSENSGSINYAEDSGYGINMDETLQGGNLVNPEKINIWNFTVTNNTIIMSGYNPYGIELYGALGNVIIANNTLNITGHVPSGITMMGYNTTIEGNNINIVGETNQTKYSADYFKPTTTGIYLQYGLNNTIKSNTINVVNGTGVQLIKNERNTTVSNNTIKVDNEITVYVDDYSNDNSIIGNDLVATSLTGDDSVSATESTTVENNTGIKTKETTITVNAVDSIVKDSVTLTATVTDENNEAVINGNVTFMINDTVIGTADVVDGVATYNTIAQKTWNNTNISAIYSGSDNYYESTSENNTVTIGLRSPTVTLISDKLSGKKGDKVTFIAQISDNDKIVNQGYVSFKLNGITLIDANTGERNHIKVVNGIAQFEYTLPSYSGKDYNITVVYGGSDYDRTEDTGVLTVVKTNTHMEGNILTVSSNGTATLNVKVFDEANDLLDRNVYVSVKVNGITMLNKVTVVNGSSNFDLSLLPSTKPYNITIITGENNNYMGSSTTVIYPNSIPKFTTTTTVSAIKGTDETSTVNVNINDADGNQVTGNTAVAIKVDGRTVTNTVAVNGTASVTIPTPTVLGDHEILAIAGETSIYASSKNTTILTV